MLLGKPFPATNDLHVTHGAIPKNIGDIESHCQPEMSH